MIKKLITAIFILCLVATIGCGTNPIDTITSANYSVVTEPFDYFYYTLVPGLAVILGGDNMTLTFTDSNGDNWTFTNVSDVAVQRAEKGAE